MMDSGARIRASRATQLNVLGQSLTLHVSMLNEAMVHRL